MRILHNLTKLCVAGVGLTLAVASAHSEDLKLQGGKFEELYKAATAAGETELVYYAASRKEEAKKLGELWNANFPDIKLTVVGKQAPALITQVEAERAAGQYRADVVTMTQPYVAKLWKEKGYYEPYKTASFDRIRP